MEGQILLQALTLIMSTIQTCFLAYLAARFRTPWDVAIEAPQRRNRKLTKDREDDHG